LVLRPRSGERVFTSRLVCAGPLAEMGASHFLMRAASSREADGREAKIAFICKSSETSGSWLSILATRGWLDPILLARAACERWLRSRKARTSPPRRSFVSMRSSSAGVSSRNSPTVPTFQPARWNRSRSSKARPTGFRGFLTREGYAEFGILASVFFLVIGWQHL